MGAFKGSAPKFCCASKFVSNIYCNKHKNLSPLKVYFILQNLKSWLQACFMLAYTFKLGGILIVLTSESANVSNFSPHHFCS